MTDQTADATDSSHPPARRCEVAREKVGLALGGSIYGIVLAVVGILILRASWANSWSSIIALAIAGAFGVSTLKKTDYPFLCRAVGTSPEGSPASLAKGVRIGLVASMLMWTIGAPLLSFAAAILVTGGFTVWGAVDGGIARAIESGARCGWLAVKGVGIATICVCLTTATITMSLFLWRFARRGLHNRFGG